MTMLLPTGMIIGKFHPESSLGQVLAKTIINNK